jgi:hypothetical protein
MFSVSATLIDDPSEGLRLLCKLCNLVHAMQYIVDRLFDGLKLKCCGKNGVHVIWVSKYFFLLRLQACVLLIMSSNSADATFRQV